MKQLDWRARSVLLLVTALILFALCIHQAREHRSWKPWGAGGAAFLVLGALKPRRKRLP